MSKILTTTISPSALADVVNEVKSFEVRNDYPIVAEMIDYIRWLADQDVSLQLTIGQVWALFHEGVRQGRIWNEVCYDLGLPEREDW